MWQIIKKEDEFDYLIDYPKNYETGKKLGTFGYSVRKKKKRKKPNGRKK